MGKLKQIEAIKQLKYRYLRCLDSKLWDEMRSVFTADAVSHYDHGRFAFEGAEAIIEFLRDTLRPGVISLHQVHHPEIEILDRKTARGRWYLEDYVIHAGTGHPVMRDRIELHGAAFYDDEYVRVRGEWKIRSTGYERTFEEQRDLPASGHSVRSRWD
jgi:bile-acid 7alpha-dehydratase